MLTIVTVVLLSYVSYENGSLFREMKAQQVCVTRANSKPPSDSPLGLKDLGKREYASNEALYIYCYDLQHQVS